MPRHSAPPPPTPDTPVDMKETVEALSEFRYRLRRFLRFAENSARAEGITILHYQVMLHCCAFAGREWATIGEIAERLQTQHHGAVALVSRCEESGLVERRPDPDDRRQVQVHLLPKGRKILYKLAKTNRTQLPALHAAIKVLG
ncbi:MAG: MarR family transcriptional regulator [Burkholderiaceae bacterium]|nr:MarR family transcriptional regulator [Burkholderiaceae bacterium]MDO9090508.1 MarR family transcriptional regulator [Burkholderiaceae bacterium]